MANSSPPPGTSDIYPDEIEQWRSLENRAKDTFKLYGYGELRTPIFEYTEVFERGLGDETEVVKKEMYTFKDRGGRSLTLRPEGTAGVMRSMVGTDVMNGNEKRIYYIGPMFRGEKPAAGRRRQFHQIGVENVGRISPELDAECIVMLMHYLDEIGITGSKLLLNTRGCVEDRAPAEEAIRTHFSSNIDSMCDDCKERINGNVWRILDCKQKCCQGFINDAPDVVSFFSDESKAYFKRVCDILTELNIPYEVAPRLVRGLDYYVHTVFELVHSEIGAQSALAGGGRYELFLPGNKKPVIGVGFAVGLERLIMAQEALGVNLEADKDKIVFLVSLGEKARDYNIKYADTLRKVGVKVIAEVELKSMKAQMRYANRIGADYTIICGDDELASNLLVFKDMEEGTQFEKSPEEIIEMLK